MVDILQFLMSNDVFFFFLAAAREGGGGGGGGARFLSASRNLNERVLFSERVELQSSIAYHRKQKEKSKKSLETQQLEDAAQQHNTRKHEVYISVIWVTLQFIDKNHTYYT